MKKLCNFLFALLCFYISDLKAQDHQKISQILKLTINKLATIKNISYTVDNYILNVGDIDTTYTEVAVNKDDKTTYMRAKISNCSVNYIIFKDRSSHRFSVNECNRTYTKTVKQTPNYISWYGVLQSGLSRFDTGHISQFLDTNLVKYEPIKKVILNKKICYKIKILLPDIEGDIFSEGYMILYISEDYMLLKIEDGGKISGENTYYSFEIKDRSFQETNIKNKINEIEKSYTLLQDKSLEVSDSIKLSRYTKIITEINCKKIGNTDSSIISLKGKVYLLEFWYMACYGCMLSYPVIDSINTVYKNNPNFDLISFNLTDTDPHLLRRVQNYIIKNHITQNSYFGSRDLIRNLFGETGFPLFVIIDDTKIKYLQLGYNDELFNNLTKNIEDSLLKYIK
ncbi:MAG: TlpA disulfide reductase family protein [Bacteroidota bacterium]